MLFGKNKETVAKDPVLFKIKFMARDIDFWIAWPRIVVVQYSTQKFTLLYKHSHISIVWLNFYVNNGHVT